MGKELNEDTITKKDIFMSGFKSKIGYSFTYKDLNEFEAIIDFYEQRCKKQKEVIDMFLNIVNKSKMLLNNPDLLDLYFKIKRCQNEFRSNK